MSALPPPFSLPPGSAVWRKHAGGVGNVTATVNVPARDLIFVVDGVDFSFDNIEATDSQVYAWYQIGGAGADIGFYKFVQNGSGAQGSSYSWRGAIPLFPGDSASASIFEPTGYQVSASIWGHVLPTWATIPY